MNILSLNVCGVGIVEKSRKIKQLCIRNRVTFLGLQETRMVNVDLFKLKSIWGNYNFDFATSNF